MDNTHQKILSFILRATEASGSFSVKVPPGRTVPECSTMGQKEPNVGDVFRCCFVTSLRLAMIDSVETN